MKIESVAWALAQTEWPFAQAVGTAPLESVPRFCETLFLLTLNITGLGITEQTVRVYCISIHTYTLLLITSASFFPRKTAWLVLTSSTLQRILSDATLLLTRGHDGNGRLESVFTPIIAFSTSHHTFVAFQTLSRYLSATYILLFRCLSQFRFRYFVFSSNFISFLWELC
jgi:hypothetical protein